MADSMYVVVWVSGLVMSAPRSPQCQSGGHEPRTRGREAKTADAGPDEALQKESLSPLLVHRRDAKLPVFQ